MPTARPGEIPPNTLQAARDIPRPWGRYPLALFAAMQTVSLSRASVALILGDWVNDVAGMLNAGSVFALFVATWWFSRNFGVRLHGYSRVWICTILVFVMINCARGFQQGLLLKFVVYDTFSFLIILCFVLLGAIPQAFDEVRRQWFWVLAAAIPLNLIALTDLSEMTHELSTGVRIARETISYRTQNALDVVVLCSAFAFQYSFWKRLVIASGMGLVLLQQILYQKRLETAFYLMLCALIAVAWLSAPVLERRNQLKRQIAILALVVVGLIAAVAVVKSEFVLPQAKALGARLTGSADDIDTSGNLARYTFLENERITMVIDSLEMVAPYELWFGRGMGGGVELHEFNARVLDSSERELYWNSYYLEDYGFFGRRGFEMGVAMPILKGGIVLFLFYYSAFVWVVLHWPVISQRFEHRVAFLVVVSYWAYTGYGGDFALSMVFQLTNTSLCLGACLGALSTNVMVGQPIVRRPHPRPN